MSLSIMDALINADYNLNEGKAMPNALIGKEQLHNAVILLRKGYMLEDDIDELITVYGSPDNAPDLEV